jgi:hypothetical protein
MINYVLLKNNKIADTCTKSSLTSAQIEFTMRGWEEGDVISLSDYYDEMQLNALESQSNEC